MIRTNSVATGQPLDFVSSTQGKAPRARVSQSSAPNVGASSTASGAPSASQVAAAAPVPQVGLAQHPPSESSVGNDGAAQFQRALRASVIDYRRTLARINEEKDRLLKHVGLRTLTSQTDASGFDPGALEDEEDQRFVRRLFENTRREVRRTFERLDESERADLENLDACADLSHAQRQAADQCVALEQRLRELRLSEQQHRDSFALASQRARGPLAALAGAPARSPLLRGFGLTLAIASVLSLSLMLARGPRLSESWPVSAVAVLTGLVLLAVGLWLSGDPAARRARLEHRLKSLSEVATLARSSLQVAETELLRTRAALKQTTLELRKEQRLAVQVLRRRPDLRRYTSRAEGASAAPPVPVPATVDVSHQRGRAQPRWHEARAQSAVAVAS